VRATGPDLAYNGNGVKQQSR